MSAFFGARPQRNLPPRREEDERFSDDEDHGVGPPPGFAYHDDSDTEAIERELQKVAKEGIRTRPFYMPQQDKNKEKKQQKKKAPKNKTTVEVTEHNFLNFIDNESLDEDDYDAGRASLFRHLHEKDLEERRAQEEDAQATPVGNGKSKAPVRDPILADRQRRQHRALQSLQSLVPNDLLSKVQWPSTAQTQANKGSYDHLKRKRLQLDADVSGMQPNTQPFYRAFWSAAARPPWPDVVMTEAQRLPMPLAALMDYINGHFKAKPGGLLVVHSPRHVALLCDYEMDALRLALAFILTPANAAATAQAACPAGTLHAPTLPEVTPGKEHEALQQQSQWRYVGLTLADFILLYPPVV